MVKHEQNRKEKEGQCRPQKPATLSCVLCGKKVPPEKISWGREGAGCLCPECQAEEESCGCSD